MRANADISCWHGNIQYIDFDAQLNGGAWIQNDVWGEHSELFYNGLTKQTSRMEILDKQSF